MSLLPTFTTLGSGPTVMLLHDADGGHLTFAPQVEALAASGFRAVAWDMPGYGRSAPIGSYSFKALAERCIALLEALQVDSASLVGHGMGGMVAVEVALRRPDLVRRLVLCGALPVWPAEATEPLLAPRLAALDAGQSMAQIADWLVPQLAGPDALPEGLQLARHAMGEVHPSTYRRALEALTGFDRRSALASLHLPTLAIAGEHDRIAPPEAAGGWALIPGAEGARLPGVGHWPQLEAPEAFDALLLDFLRRRPVLH